MSNKLLIMWLQNVIKKTPRGTKKMTIDEIFEGVDLTTQKKEYITVELIDGEKVTIEKQEYERILKECKGMGEIFY